MSISTGQNAILPTAKDLSSWDHFESWYQKQPVEVQALDEISSLRDAGFENPEASLPTLAQIQSIFQGNNISYAGATSNQARRFSDSIESYYSSGPTEVSDQWSVGDPQQAFDSLKKNALDFYDKGLTHIDSLLARNANPDFSALNFRCFLAYLQGAAGSWQQGHDNLAKVVDLFCSHRGLTNFDKMAITSNLEALYRKICVPYIDGYKRSDVQKIYKRNQDGYELTDPTFKGPVNQSTSELFNTLLRNSPDLLDQLHSVESSRYFSQFHEEMKGVREDIQTARDEIAELMEVKDIYKIVVSFPTAQNQIYAQVGLTPELVQTAQEGLSKPDDVSEEIWEIAQAMAQSKSDYEFNHKLMMGTMIGLVVVACVAAPYAAEVPLAAAVAVGSATGGVGLMGYDIHHSQQKLEAARGNYYADYELKGLGSRAYVEVVEKERDYAVAAAVVGLAGMGTSSQIMIRGAGLRSVAWNTLRGGTEGLIQGAADGRITDIDHVQERNLLTTGQEDEHPYQTIVYGLLFTTVIGGVAGGTASGLGETAMRRNGRRVTEIFVDYSTPELSVIAKRDGTLRPARIVNTDEQRGVIQLAFDDGVMAEVTVDPEPRVLTGPSKTGDTPATPVKQPASSSPERMKDLTANPDFVRRVDHYSRSRPDTEFEIFFDPETNSYHYVSGEEGVRQMGQMVMTTNESGQMTSARQTSEPAAPPGKNWIPVGHLHPQGNPEGVKPSVEDVLTFLNRGQTEYFTFQKNGEGSLSWSRIYTDDDGQIKLELSNNVANQTALQQAFAATANSALRFIRYNPDEELAAATPFLYWRDLTVSPPPRGSEPPGTLQTALAQLRSSPGDGDRVVVGREHDYGIYFNDLVSRGHVSIFRALDGGYYIIDHSSNGTMILRDGGARQYVLHNGEVRSLHRGTSQRAPIKLNDGDMIVFPDGQNFVFREPRPMPEAMGLPAKAITPRPVVRQRPPESIGGKDYVSSNNGSAALIDGPSGHLNIRDGTADLDVAAVSNKGIGYKDVNEDGLAIISLMDPSTRNPIQYQLSVDGMGGMGKGNLAMQRTIQVMSDELARGTPPDQAFVIAKAQLDSANDIDNGSGVALVLAKLEKKSSGEIDLHTWVYGDARGVVFRPSAGGEILRTRDQSLVQQWRDSNRIRNDFEQRTHPQAHIVMNSLAKGRGLEPPNQVSTTLQKGDWVVLASDGFWDNFDVSEVYTLLKGCRTAEEARQTLLDAALAKMDAYHRGEMDRGAKPDNINIIVTRVGFEQTPVVQQPPSPPPPPRHLRSVDVLLGKPPKPSEDYLTRNRVNPRVGGQDTIMIEPDGSVTSIHNPDLNALFIGNPEILGMEMPPSQHKLSIDGIPYGRTTDGRIVMQQQGQRGCVATATTMLAMDNGGRPDTGWVKACNLSNLEEASRSLERSGLSPIYTNRHGNKQEIGRQLETLIAQNGSGVLSIGGEIGGHVVAIDSFSMQDNTAIIRDPFHGWSITVPADSILRRMGNHLELVQVGR